MISLIITIISVIITIIIIGIILLNSSSKELVYLING